MGRFVIAVLLMTIITGEIYFSRKQLVRKVKSMSHLSAYHQVAIVTIQLCILSEFFLTLLNGICQLLDFNLFTFQALIEVRYLQMEKSKYKC